MSRDEILYEILYEIKPELKEKGDLYGLRTIEDLELDSVDIIELLSKLEEISKVAMENIDGMLDVIQEFDKIEKWIEEQVDIYE